MTAGFSAWMAEGGGLAVSGAMSRGLGGGQAGSLMVCCFAELCMVGVGRGKGGVWFYCFFLTHYPGALPLPLPLPLALAKSPSWDQPEGSWSQRRSGSGCGEGWTDGLRGMDARGAAKLVLSLCGHFFPPSPPPLPPQGGGACKCGGDLFRLLQGSRWAVRALPALLLCSPHPRPLSRKGRGETSWVYSAVIILARSWPQPPSMSWPAESRSLVTIPWPRRVRAMASARSQLGRW